MSIQECRGSGLSVSEWCRQRGVTTATYYRWERELLTGVRKNGAPPAGERTDLFCLRQQIGGDWQGSPPQLNDEAGRVLGARGRVLHLRLQELRAGDR